MCQDGGGGRASRAPIGRYLKAEMHIREVAERYGCLLEQYLRNCGEHRTDLGHQVCVCACVCVCVCACLRVRHCVRTSRSAVCVRETRV